MRGINTVENDRNLKEELPNLDNRIVQEKQKELNRENVAQIDEICTKVTGIIITNISKLAKEFTQLDTSSAISSDLLHTYIYTMKAPIFSSLIHGESHDQENVNTQIIGSFIELSL